jgi:hypothetical protein
VNRFFMMAVGLGVMSIVRAEDVAPSVVSTSPDEWSKVVQSGKQTPDGDLVFSYKIMHVASGHMTPLNVNDPPDSASYPAGFRFSADSQWLVRMQKLAAGESTLFLYHRMDSTFVPTSDKPLGDLAWDFFFSQPDAKGIDKNNLSQETILVKGMEDNYKSTLKETWPDSQYMVISLASGESDTVPIGPWRCVYDMKAGKFSIPPDMAAFNKSKMPWKKPGK